MSIDPQIKIFRAGARTAFPWDGDRAMHQIQPSQRTSVDYYVTLDGSHSSYRKSQLGYKRIVTLDLWESPAFAKGAIDMH